MAVSPKEEFVRRQSIWFYPPEYDIDVYDFVINRCNTEEEKSRVEYELNYFEQYNLIPMLRMVIYLVDHFRKNNIVWGVGRGSSVASFVLYKIGIHRIDSLKYNLDFHEFIKISI